MIKRWRARLLEGAADVFGAESAATKPAIDVLVLHAKIGELTLASDFLAGALESGSTGSTANWTGTRGLRP